MLVIPSLDLDPDISRAYASSVAHTIHVWERFGFGRVQLVMGPPNRALPDERFLEEALRDTHCITQIAGRFEATEEIDSALAGGADFIVLGTRALDEMDWLASVAGRFPGQLMLSTPARERRARSRGAVRTLPLDLRDLAGEIRDFPLAGLIVDLGAEGEIGPPDLALLEDVAEDVAFPVQVTGGLPDLGTLRDFDFRGIAGAIVSAARLASDFDGHTIARGFSD
jgi:phosphoribosylformimino-5-aminoimidazole carboxamide ribonucleotide (ProFAR) isomerase